MSLASFCAALGLGGDPEAVLEPLDRFYADVDDRLAAATVHLNLPCAEGCDGCCHEAVFLSAPEMLAVGRELLDWPKEELRGVLDAMSGLARRFEDELELLEELEPGAERDEVAARIKFSCPMLGSDGRCRVYGGRELNARTFGQSRDALRGEPYGCELSHARLKVLGPEPLAQLPDARALRAELRDRVPGVGEVRVFPWWLARFGASLLAP